jgi:N-acetylglucosaminyl-diphospho-decaprenol L-rhamnosyltransferase
LTELAIVIASWNVASLLANCLRSIPAGAEGLDYQVIVVDNASSDGSADMVARDFPAVRLIRNTENVGFGKANNQGICAGQGRYVLLLNSDTSVPAGSLTELVRFMDQHPDAGACGPRLLRPDGMPQPYAFGGDPTLGYLLVRGLKQVLFHRYLHDWTTDMVQEVDWVSGACLLVRRQAIEQVGLLDESIFMYFEDNDWCLRIRRAGWKIYYNPQVSIVHIGGQSLAQHPAARHVYHRSLTYFYAKHYGLLARLLLRVGLLPYRLLVRY